jgi:hypothetical protein
MYAKLLQEEETCRHGDVVGHCYICDLQEEVEQLKAENKRLRALAGTVRQS